MRVLARKERGQCGVIDLRRAGRWAGVVEHQVLCFEPDGSPSGPAADDLSG
jgi:hypothetical protein